MVTGGTHLPLTRLGSLAWRPDVSRDGMLLIGLVVGLAIAMGRFAVPVDALNYWNAGTSPDVYPTSWSEVREGLLFYPPPVIQLARLLQPIGWPAFITGLMVATFGAFWFCARSWSLPLVVLGMLSYAIDAGSLLTIPRVLVEYALLGNVQWLLAAAAMVAIRRPALWALLLLAKMTTAVGWWWHVLRREWRAAAIGAGVSAVVIGVSFALDPQLWADFAGFVSRNYMMANPPIPAFPVPLGVRLVTAALLVTWGALTGRTWTVPVATGWALPALWGFGFLPFWIGPIRVAVTNRLSRAGSRAVPATAP